MFFPSVLNCMPHDVDIAVRAGCRPKYILDAGTQFLTGIAILLTLIG
jgi:hypothetical protein